MGKGKPHWIEGNAGRTRQGGRSNVRASGSSFWVGTTREVQEGGRGEGELEAGERGRTEKGERGERERGERERERERERKRERWG